MGVGLIGVLVASGWLGVACSDTDSPSLGGAAGSPGEQEQGGGGEAGGAVDLGGAASEPDAGGAGGDKAVVAGGGAGTDSGGAAAGGGGSSSLAGAGNEAGSLSVRESLIDDFEDADGNIEAVDGRQGYWYTTLDTYGSTIVPVPADATHVQPGTTNCRAGSIACLIVSGVTVAVDEDHFVFPYATVAFSLMKEDKIHPYDASTYSGIKLWVRGDATVRISVPTLATARVGWGGTCAVDCDDLHGVSVALSNAWKEVTLPFATIEQEGFGAAVAFDSSQLLGLTVLFPAGTTFNAAIDDVTFY